MKNLVTPIILLLLGVILYLQADTNQQKQLVRIETAGIDLKTHGVDIEYNRSIELEEGRSSSYSSLIEKNVIPLQIFDFFNIF